MPISSFSHAYMLATGLVLICAVAIIPKRYSMTEYALTVLFASQLQFITDIILDGKLDLYGYFYHGVDVYSIVTCMLLYPGYTIVYMNFFPYWKGWRRQALYILACSSAAVGYEWTAVMSGFFYYNGWKLWYSALSYPILHLTLAVHHGLMMRVTRRGRLALRGGGGLRIAGRDSEHGR